MEYELSFSDFTYKDVIKGLKKVNAKKVHNLIPFKIAYFYLANEKDFKKGFVRIRNEQDTVTITTKITDSKYPTEYETSVNTTYEEMVEIIKHSGLVLKIESIKFREKWEVKGCNEVVFDLWPGLPLIMEVDCKDEKGLINLCNELGLDYKKGFTQHKHNYLYGIEPSVTQNISNLAFNNFNKLLKTHIIKNKELFNSLTPAYYKKFLNKKYHKLL